VFPFEEIPRAALQRTRLGRDLVEQDCRLKQFAVSLLHPDTPTGAAYWNGLRTRARSLGLDTGWEMETIAFQKVWIVPGNASLGGKDPDQPLGNPGLASLGARETDRGVWIEECDLKVMFEPDYLALEHHQPVRDTDAAGPLSDASVVFREIVVPVLTDEVNHGGGLRRCARSIAPSCWRRGSGETPLPAFASLAARLDCGSPGAFGVVRDDAWAESSAEIYRRYLALFEQSVLRCARRDEDGRPRVRFAGAITLADEGRYFRRWLSCDKRDRPHVIRLWFRA
jgi:hypothetical protein